MNWTASAIDWIRSLSLMMVVMMNTSNEKMTDSPPHPPAVHGGRAGAGLFARPDGFAFLGEGGGACLGVGRGEDVGDARALQVEHVRLAPVARLRHDGLGG